MSDIYGLPIVPYAFGYLLEIEGVSCTARERGDGQQRRWVIRQEDGVPLATARRLAPAVRIARLALQLKGLGER